MQISIYSKCCFKNLSSQGNIFYHLHIPTPTCTSELDIKLSEPWKSHKFYCGVLSSEMSFPSTNLFKNKWKLKIKLLESLKCRTNSPASWKLQIIHVQYSYLNIYHESDFFSTCISKMLKLFLVIYFWYMYMRNETLQDWLTS